MILHKDNIFYTPIYQGFLNLNTTKLKNICYNIKDSSNIEQKQYSSFNGWHSELYFKRLNEFGELLDNLANLLQTIKTDFNFKKEVNLNINQYWININGNNSYHVPHIHRGCILSAVYYITAPKNSGNLELHNPNQNLPYHIQKEWFNDFKDVTELYSIEPEENKIIIFPSWLKHSVSLNKSKEDRISIAFDIKVNDDR